MAAAAMAAPVVVMVTGGTGLVGKAMQKVISEDPQANDETWIFLSSKDGDLVDRTATEAVFEKCKPTHVIHLAARVGGLFHNMAKKVEFYRENTIMNDNIMECCRINGVKKLVSCLSTCIFPDKTTYIPHRRDDAAQRPATSFELGVLDRQENGRLHESLLQRAVRLPVHVDHPYKRVWPSRQLQHPGWPCDPRPHPQVLFGQAEG
eukprot:gb/GFBE01029545.1/.p1 GENE.gb/GFBE01029545.1/~~gb/GFBE01029545.1/.p1  ORF type:complete len:206 (+),score=30.38 gb/GFBE01029545.1/:1-618(+)